MRRLTDLLAGKISVETEVGKGTTFCVWLPITRSPDAPLCADAAASDHFWEHSTGCVSGMSTGNGSGSAQTNGLGRV